MSEMVAAALDLAALGFHVFPLVPGTKVPIHKGSFHNATTDKTQIEIWWTETPDANIGVATGKVSGITVLDVDIKPWKRKRGDETLAALTGKFSPLPITATQRTWSGGLQHFFQYREGIMSTVDRFGAWLDCKNDGGYVVAPPSCVAEDQREGMYEWIWSPAATPLAAMPEWLVAIGTTQRTRSFSDLAKGGRNVALTSLAGALRRYDVGPDVVRAALQAQNGALSEPLPDREIESIVSSADRNFEPADEEDGQPGGERYTDRMNARLVFEHSEGLVRHADEMKDKFYVYDGKRWELRARHALTPLADRVADDLLQRADALRIEIGEKAAAVVKLPKNSAAKLALKVEVDGLEAEEKAKRAGALRLESKDGAYAAFERMKASAHIELNALDAKPFLLNVQNGVLDLDSGQLRAHDPRDLITKLGGTEFLPEATAPTWGNLLERVVPDPEVRSFLQRSAGIALCDSIEEHCLWFLYGTGRNGKGTFTRALAFVLGDYGANTKASTFMIKQHGDDKRNDVAKLRGARLVTANEAEHGQAFAESLVKELSGGDPVTCRLLFCDDMTFAPTFKIWLSANHKPAIRGTDEGIWSRIHLVPFEVFIPEAERNKHLDDLLQGDAPGILNWMLEGYRAWREIGLKPPAAVQAATAAYRAESDALADFIEESGVMFDSKLSVKKATLYNRYKEWATEAGSKALSNREFGQYIGKRAGVSETRSTQRADRQARYWLGIGLPAPEPAAGIPF